MSGSVGGVPVAGDLEEAERLLREWARVDRIVMGPSGPTTAAARVLAEYDRRGAELAASEKTSHEFAAATGAIQARLGAERDSLQREVNDLHQVIAAGRVEHNRERVARDSLARRSAVLSSLLRGMARRAVERRRKSNSYLKIAARRDNELGTLRREERQVRADRDMHRTERLNLWKILGRPDGSGTSVELCDAVADERDARRRFQQDAADREGELIGAQRVVAAVRALADDLDPNTEMHIADAIHEALDGSTNTPLRTPELDAAFRENDTDPDRLDDDTYAALTQPTRGDYGPVPDPREDETPEPAPLPRRDDQIAAWIKAARDRQNGDGTAWDRGRWNVLDDLLEDYRLHADTGTPIDQHACEGGYCCVGEPPADYVPPPKGTWISDLTEVSAAVPVSDEWLASAAPQMSALVGTYADPEFRAHQDHKHAVEGCGYCPTEEDSDG